MSDHPAVSVVILTYNNPDLLRQCIQSASNLEYPDLEIVVVDNASTDNTAQMVRDEFPDVNLVVRPVNSPCAARNAGYWAARGEYVLTLDHDMVIPDLQIAHHAVRAFEALPEVGLLSFKICSPDSPTEPHHSHWFYPTPIEAKDRFFYTTYFSEGAAFFRAEVLKQTGGYDERFFHAAENIDLAMKILDNDWRILYCPNLSTVELVVSDHLSTRRTQSNEFSMRNRLWVAWKHYPFPKAITYVVPRVGAASVRSVRYRWFDYFLAGLRQGVFAPAEIRAERRPLSPAVWAEMERIEGTSPDAVGLI